MGVHLERCGRGEKILFVHGAADSMSSWCFQRVLQAAWEVILLDLPGHGKSAGAGCCEIADYAESVRGAIRDNDLEGCYLAGHSMGGAIGITLALSSREMFAGLILVGTGARLRASPKILEDILKEKEETVRALTTLAFSKKAPPELVEAGFEAMMASPKEVIHGDFTACDRFDVMDAVKSIDLPTLVIGGANDVLTPPKYSEYLHSEIGGSRLLVIPDAGHMVMREKPGETNQAIEAFLTRR